MSRVVPVGTTADTAAASITVAPVEAHTRGNRWTHVTAVLVVPGCLALAAWQILRALGGNSLSWAYVFEWPIFAGYGAFGNSDQAYEVFAGAGHALAFSQWGNSITGGPALQAGQWYYVAVTNVGDTVNLYLDGTLVASGSLPIDTSSDSSFYVGRIPGSLGDIRQLDGLADVP